MNWLTQVLYVRCLPSARGTIELHRFGFASVARLTARSGARARERFNHSRISPLAGTSLSVVAVDRAGNVSRVTNFAFSVVGTWDAAADFPRTAPSENPAHDQYGNTVWTYLYSRARIHDPTLYRPLPHFDPVGGAVGAQWNMGGTGPTIAFPLVGVFGSSSIGFHPDRDSFAILGWRSPYTGTVAIEFTVRLEDPGAQNTGNGIAWSIDRGNTTLQTQVLTYGYDEHAAITTDVTVGDQFYAGIDNRGDSNYDTTVGEFQVHTIFP